MLFRFKIPLLGAIVTLLSFQLSAQGFGVRVDSAEVSTGQIVCIPVRAQGLSNIISFQYSLTWNPQVLTFDRVQNLNLPGWMTTDFGSVTPGLLLVSWADVDGLPRNRDNGAVLYEVCLKVVGPLGSSSYIIPGSEGFPPTSGGAEAYNATLENVWNPALNVPGLVEVTSLASTSDAAAAMGLSSFQLSPNPTPGATQVMIKSSFAGAALLSVSDALGRTVLEKKIAVRTGENIFDLPAEAFKAKGMYQVSIKTEKGVSTQMLSVN